MELSLKPKQEIFTMPAHISSILKPFMKEMYQLKIIQGTVETETWNAWLAEIPMNWLPLSEFELIFSRRKELL